MKFTIAMLPLFAFAVGAPPARAQNFQYNARWYVGVRENVLALQDRHRARIEALEARHRRRDGAAGRGGCPGDRKGARSGRDRRSIRSATARGPGIAAGA